MVKAQNPIAFISHNKTRFLSYTQRGSSNNGVEHAWHRYGQFAERELAPADLVPDDDGKRQGVFPAQIYSAIALVIHPSVAGSSKNEFNFKWRSSRPSTATALHRKPDWQSAWRLTAGEANCPAAAK